METNNGGRRDLELWKENVAACGANKRDRSLDKYHIDITKESIKCSCGQASQQRLSVKFHVRRGSMVLDVKKWYEMC